ncbi:AmpG family muropeptide MFS transporter [Neisseriaceae bacterium B1]
MTDFAAPESTLESAHKLKLLATLTLLGFSAGLPLLLIFSTLSLWLTEAGIERKMVTMFSWAALGYSFKFVWSPLMDTLRLPVLTRVLGKRRAWLFLAQLLMITAVCMMALTNPAAPVSGSTNPLAMLAIGAVLLGFSAATQDVAIDAYRIEVAPHDLGLQSALSAAYTAGYRVGMFASGAGSLFLAAKLGSSGEHYIYAAWRTTYLIMAGLMGLGVLTTLLIREPQNKERTATLSAADNGRLLAMFVLSVLAFIFAFRVSGSLFPEKIVSPLLAFVAEAARLLLSLGAGVLMAIVAVKLGMVKRETVVNTWYAPIADFFARYGKKALILLALIGLYRISDIVSGVISNVFYANLGFSKEEIAWAVKTFGVAMSVLGGFAGGLLAQKFRIMNMMMLGAIAASATNILFVFLAWSGHDVALMYTAVGLDNFAAGLAGTVFVAFLSALTNIRFTAVQYALFSSLMTLFPKVLGGYSGAIVDKMGYDGFFGLTALLGLPILGLVWWADKVLFQEKE